MSDYVVAGLIILGPWLLGGFLGWRWGRTRKGFASALGAGLAVVILGLMAFLLTAPPSPEQACGEDECTRIFGHWLEASLAKQWPIYALVAWIVSCVGFSRLHRSGRPAS